MLNATWTSRRCKNAEGSHPRESSQSGSAAAAAVRSARSAVLPACVSQRRLIEPHQEIKSDILSGDIKWAFYCWMNGAVEDEDVEIERGFLLACGATQVGATSLIISEEPRMKIKQRPADTQALGSLQLDFSTWPSFPISSSLGSRSSLRADLCLQTFSSFSSSSPFSSSKSS